MTMTKKTLNNPGVLPPFVFTPIKIRKIWGGEEIDKWKGQPPSASDVGESWEISGVEGHETRVKGTVWDGYTVTELLRELGPELVGEKVYAKCGDEFPLLIKYIYAGDDLSIQVHPDDAMARSLGQANGKSEMWYVIAAGQRGRIHCGFRSPITREYFLRAVDERKVPSLMRTYDARRGDCFYIPAGRIHSLGAGTMVAEIQQTSNATYRIYDFDRTDSSGRKRELHTALAAQALNYSDTSEARIGYSRKDNTPSLLIGNDKFITSILPLSASCAMSPKATGSFIILMCIGGSAALTSGSCDLSLRRGDTVLLPAATESAMISALSEKTEMLTIHM